MKATFFYRETFSSGIAYLSQILKNSGHQVDLIFDLNPFDNKFFKNTFLGNLFAAEVDLPDRTNEETDIFCFSVMTADYKWAVDLSRRLKKKYPQKPIIFGGVHPTLIPDDVMNEDSVDMICIGEGEESILELADCIDRGESEFYIQNLWFKKNGKIIKNKLKSLSLRSLDQIPFPDYDLFLDKMPSFYKAYPNVIASRGCPFSCTFCSNAALRRVFCAGSEKANYIRQRSVENVICELQLLKSKYKIKGVVFQDDVFTMNSEWLDSFLSEYKKKINIPFSCVTHPKMLSQKDAYALKAADCRLVIVGVQSGSEKVRRDLLKRYESNTDIINFAKICHNARLNFSFNHIFNLPYEKESDLEEAIRLYNETRPKIIDTYSLIYLPKIEIIESAIQAGVLKDSDREKIEHGELPVYTTHFRKANGTNSYDRFAVFFALLPIIPKRTVDFLLKTRLYRHFSKVPLIFVAVTKLILNVRTGTSFMQLAPLKSVLWYMCKRRRSKKSR